MQPPQEDVTETKKSPELREVAETLSRIRARKTLQQNLVNAPRLIALLPWPSGLRESISPDPTISLSHNASKSQDYQHDDREAYLLTSS